MKIKFRTILLDNVLRNVWHKQEELSVHKALSASAKLAIKLPRYRSKEGVRGYQWMH